MSPVPCNLPNTYVCLPLALRLQVYISGKSFMPMLQLVHVALSDSQVNIQFIFTFLDLQVDLQYKERRLQKGLCQY